jgi:hypothetical protein
MDDIEGGLDVGVGWPVPSRDVIRELEPPAVDWSEPEPLIPEPPLTDAADATPGTRAHP